VGIKAIFRMGRLQLLIMLIVLNWSMGINVKIDRYSRGSFNLMDALHKYSQEDQTNDALKGII
jgi:hypothetical protein